MHWPLAVGIAMTLLVAGVIVGQDWWESLKSFWPYAFIAVGWIPMIARTWKWFWKARRIVRRLRVGTCLSTLGLGIAPCQFGPAIYACAGQPCVQVSAFLTNIHR